MITTRMLIPGAQRDIFLKQFRLILCAITLFGSPALAQSTPTPTPSPTPYQCITCKVPSGAAMLSGTNFLNYYDINGNTSPADRVPEISYLSDGSFVVAWRGNAGNFSPNHTVAVQHFAADGIGLNDPIDLNANVNGYANFNSFDEIGIIGTTDGGYAVHWLGSPIWRQYVQKFDASDNPLGSTTTFTSDNNNDQGEIAALPNGGFVVTYRGWVTGQGSSVCVQEFDRNGAKVGAEYILNGPGYDEEPAIAVNSDGTYAVVWETNGDGTPTTDPQLNVQLFIQGGTIVGSVIRLDTDASRVTAQDQEPAAIALKDDSFVVAWNGQLNSDGNYRVTTQTIDSDGSLIGEPVQISPSNALPNPNTPPVLDATEDGGYVASWVTNDGRAFAQKFGADGQPDGSLQRLGAAMTINVQVDVAALAHGGYVVVWRGYDGINFKIYAQEYDLNGDPLGDLKTLDGPIGQNLKFDNTEPKVAATNDGGYTIVWSGSARNADGSTSGVVHLAAYTGMLVADSTPSPTPSPTSSPTPSPTPYECIGTCAQEVCTRLAPPINGTGNCVFLSEPCLRCSCDITGTDQLICEPVTITRYNNSNEVCSPYFYDTFACRLNLETLSPSPSPTTSPTASPIETPNPSSYPSPTPSTAIGPAQFIGVQGQLNVANNSAQNSDFDADVTVLDDGSWVVSWSFADGNTAISNGVAIQKYNTDGTKAGTPKYLHGSSTTSRNDLYSQVEATSGGGFVVQWRGDTPLESNNIFVQKFDSDGNTVGEKIVLASVLTNAGGGTSPASDSNAELAVLDNGGYVVTWRGGGNYQTVTGTYDIYVQEFNASGTAVGSHKILTIGGANDEFPQVTGGKNGTYAVTWEATNGGEARYVSVFEGGVGSTPVRIDSSVPMQYEYHDLTALNDGTFVAVWGGSNGGPAIGVQLIGSDGALIGNNIVLHGNPNSPGSSDSIPSVAATSDGGFVVTWQADGTTLHPFSTNIVSQKFDASGNPINEIQQLDSPAHGDSDPQVTAITGGGYVVTWVGTSDTVSDIFVQEYEANGLPLGEIVRLDGDGAGVGDSVPSVAANYNGGYVVVWQGTNSMGEKVVYTAPFTRN